MKKCLTVLFFVALFFAIGTESRMVAAQGNATSAAGLSISYSPAIIMQGEPFLVSIGGVMTSKIKKLTFDGAAVPVFSYRNLPTALVGVDLRKNPGTYKLVLTLSGGQVVTKNVTVLLRPQIAEPLGIPNSLGGNTTASQNNMVSELVAENKTLTNIKTFAAALWTKKFLLPLSNIFVTDPYGYSRQTGVYSIPHKGVDYRADIGTPVMAINRGIVRVVQNYSDYGRTVVVDHGLGVMSFYLHLSKINVKVGQLVTQGQIIALSGDTGYTLGPHLHLSVRVGGISIDPVKFFALFQ
jgi:murein DD-endopeptidase MepM/ murein hydrolase activator NlpD